MIEEGKVIELIVNLIERIKDPSEIDKIIEDKMMINNEKWKYGSHKYQEYRQQYLYEWANTLLDNFLENAD